jgi:MFS family permease
MTGWLAHQVLHLYPLAYRRRYGEEMRALLEDQPPRAGTVVDLLGGAARAHLRPADAQADAVGAADRVRASTSGVLLCWVFFAAAGFGYYKTTEDAPFSATGHAHPVLRDAHLAVQALALIASAAVVLGALPLIFAALTHVRRDPTLRRKVALPFLPIIVFAVLTAVVLAIAHTQPQNHTSNAGSGMAIVWGIAGLACGATCVLACRAALFSTPVPPARLRAALTAGTVVTGAMLAIALATTLYAIALAADASHLAAAPNGPFQVLSVTASLIVQLVVMVGAGVLATIATARAWRVENQLA